MEYATLGNTGLLVSKLCLGTMTFGDGRGLFKGISSVDQTGADELVKTSIGGGINFFDTADNYTESTPAGAAKEGGFNNVRWT
jgi:aryl-alcohol dehydrogenase-like predicted oxidoreductase